ncbi:cytochrome c [Catalinimonas alkaloidigena]|uniref:Cytochrome c n=1 Tax=Catalinimonas alkaloidigena TaxID=1075417 RepID=A0A1G9KTT8_9BACT|nr:ThuA domain-containing protein [Catalinimonas alkaloidigena]SDL53062.1 cytochrome c [Catalinimonas alkaloidigena]
MSTTFFRRAVLGALCVFFTLNACRNAQEATTARTASPAGARVLVFSKTRGWHHSSIPNGIAAVQQLGREGGFAVDTTTNAAYFTEDSLWHYRAVIFLNTTSNVLNPEQQAAFERYIQAGGGFVGVHSAADTEYEWPWYDKLVGAHFANHPGDPNVRKATVDVVDPNHPATAGLPAHWERSDEWYSYRSFYPGIRVLMYLDENTYEGGTNGANHPIAWYHDFDGGRAFYTGLGHTEESYTEPQFLQHLMGGIQYAMGKGTSDGQPQLDYSKAYAQVMPEENRFVKTVLVNDLDNPMEVAVAHDGRVFYTELKNGKLSMYDPRTQSASVVHQFPVALQGGTGLIGLTLDPHFDDNHWLYVYYTPPTDREPIDFRLSRFTLQPNNTLDLASEKVLLTVPVQKNSGAHHGGSLAWDKEGNLYLSTGDSSSPFPSNGYAPIDERPGDEYYSLDAQRSAANTNDLKGKILRIHPEADGTYTIPEGNLFPKGMDKTRPEIYTMGLRNPYRIAVNPKSSVLYWGEIGPDAGNDSIQGPRGYDEFNQAKQAGNFGWPYFIGNNYAYADWDFATEKAGPKFNPQAPVNESPNNTGLRELPPAQPAMLYYPYAASEEFPELGVGGRSAMAGEFYTFDPTSDSPTKFPEYYDGALFIFEWMRNWVMALRVDENDNYLRVEPFMASNGDFRRPIDLAFGQDGVMYMLEYGSIYGIDNEDARLVKIEYNRGNRPPVASASIYDSTATALAQSRSYLTSDRRYHTTVLRERTGEAPLTVTVTGRGTDPDDDNRLTYQWLFDGKTVGATTARATHTYTQPGTYEAILKVTDQDGAVAMDTLSVKVGNTTPTVTIRTPNNKSFYWEGEPFHYSVQVTDPEDASIDPKNIKVTYSYNPQPSLLPQAPQLGHQETPTAASASLGQTLIASSDCKACHTVDKVSVGPSFTAVAERYHDQAGAQAMLAQKIIQGGGGNWGTQYVMSAHPQISQKDAEEMVRYIFSLGEPKEAQALLPAQGALPLRDHNAEKEPRGRYTLVATYTDQGGTAVGPLTGAEVITLRPARLNTADADEYKGFTNWGGRLGEGDHKSYIMLRNIDLTHLKQFTYGYSSWNKAGEIEVRMDSYAGPVISRVAYTPTGESSGAVTSVLDKPIEGRHDLYFVVVKRDKPNEDIITLRTIQFER